MNTTKIDIASATIALHQSTPATQEQAIEALANRIVDAAIDDDLEAALESADDTWRGMIALDEVRLSC